MEENVRKEKRAEMAEKTGKYTFSDLKDIVTLLRAPDGCPWDKEQTHESIRANFIEETYEVMEAIDTKNPALLREELGDVLMQIMLHAEMESEKGVFDVNDVVDEVSKKLVHRHPHVFGDVVANDTGTVLSNWEKIKGEEKQQRKTVTDKLNAIPPMLPALMRAEKVGKKASMFDFPTTEDVYAKLAEETEEVKAATAQGNAAAIEEEIGDLLLTVTSLSRKLGVDPELALTRATDKFIHRFSLVEQRVADAGKRLEDLSMVDLDKIWADIKD